MPRPQRRRYRPRWRLVTYAIVAFNLIMAAWLIADPALTDSDCGVLSATACTGHAGHRHGIAVAVIIALWALGNLLLGALWIATTRPRRRPCPQCSTQVTDTSFRCPHCNHDFHTGMQPQSG